ncbi:hypothetical protein J32TS6_23030 [Virgibacillus pantothenticus]|nr:hypothetical protein J32TS6_23030 [Virgibacillus pantothenticus]SIS72068.1 hypothetical protein SAMN05421787_102392 [Virgibacillus pantothenticus]
MGQSETVNSHLDKLYNSISRGVMALYMCDKLLLGGVKWKKELARIP